MSAAPSSSATPSTARTTDTTAGARPRGATTRPAETGTATAGAARADDGEEARVISTQERYLPGSEPHSPGTWGHAFDDPRNTRRSTSVLGPIGLVHTSSADLGQKGLIRFSVAGEYFTGDNFPVLNAIDVRSAGNFSVSVVPLEFLEAYLDYRAAANTNSTSSPALIQALGDITFGVKASKKWMDGVYGGIDLRLQSFSGVGNQDISRYAFGVTPQLLGLYDFRDQFRFPLRVHLNVGFALDGTGDLVRQHALTASEEFALGINRFNRFVLGAALEAPLPVATPFVEYELGVPLGVNGPLLAPDGKTVDVAAVLPQTLGIGAKLTAFKDVTLFGAVDIGLTRSVALGVPATQPWNVIFGASFAVDPLARGETKLVETIRERNVAVAKQEPKTGRAAGVIVDAKTQKPIPGVIVAMVGSGLPPVASDVDSGRFLTHELPGGPVKLEAVKDGYKPADQEVVLEPGKTTQVQLALEQLAKKATFEVSTTAKKKPVAAQVVLKGAQDQTVTTKEGEPKPAVVDTAPGKYTVTVDAPGFLSQTREVQVSEGAKMALAFELVPVPKKRLVIVKENKIEIAQQVHFATGKATILADSFPLLAEVVDAIVKNDIKKIRIEGHTDNRGNKAKNLKLSQDRAKAVGDYLVQQGIDPSRIDTAGFGDTRPIAPNLTARGRELNRRVEFIILQR